VVTGTYSGTSGTLAVAVSGTTAVVAVAVVACVVVAAVAVVYIARRRSPTAPSYFRLPTFFYPHTPPIVVY
jgi:hypothetical protein